MGQLAGVGGGVGLAGAEDEHGLPDGDLIAGGQRDIVNALAVDKRTIGAAEVGDKETVGAAPHLGMPARDLGVMETNAVRRIPPDREDRFGDFKLLAFVSAFDDQEPGHAEVLLVFV